MVTRRRLRSVLTALGLYLAAALLVGYFGVNAFTGDYGLNARQNIDQQIAKLSGELAAVKTCSTSAPARCSIMWTPMTWCSSSSGQTLGGHKRQRVQP